jgi:hypothetical protein
MLKKLTTFITLQIQVHIKAKIRVMVFRETSLGGIKIVI